MRKLYAFAAPVAVIAAFMVMPAISSAVTLETEREGPLPSGAEVVGNSSNLTFTTAIGALECSSNEVHGTVSSNGGATATASISGGSFTGPEPEPAGSCKTSIESPYGGTLRLVIGELVGLPWTLSLSGSSPTGSSSITSGSIVAIPLVFYFDNPLTGKYEPAAECVYGAPLGLADTFNFGGPLSDSLSGQKMTLIESSGECAPEGTLAGSFAITSEGEEVTAS